MLTAAMTKPIRSVFIIARQKTLPIKSTHAGRSVKENSQCGIMAVNYNSLLT